MKTAEFVSPQHPDKLCDQIADAILDAHLEKDSHARVAAEVMGGHGVINVIGEITSDADLDIPAIIKTVLDESFEIHTQITQQSSEIARGVDTVGAGDQGIMTGFATAETTTYMPLEYETARMLCRMIYEEFPHDGKVQVTLNEDNAVHAVVASFQHAKSKKLASLVREAIPAEHYYINPAGEWEVGGFEADAGLSGRKIVVDNYGPEVPVGGGAFSGKDPTKVDRSGAYMARRIALDYLEKYDAREVLVKLAYAIGEEKELMGVARVDDEFIMIDDYDLRPQAIIKNLNLTKQSYTPTARWGHFGRNFPWDIDDEPVLH